MPGALAAPERPATIDERGWRNKVHPADVSGRWLRARRVVFAALTVFWMALPLVSVGGHPAVFIDLPERRFHLFGAVLNAQEFWRLVLVLAAFAFAVLFVTAWLGRAWCGWACPQTVFLEGFFRPVERRLEGPREARRRLDAAPWSAGKVARETLKQGVFVLGALGLAHVWLAYFATPSQVVAWVRGSPADHPVAFGWTVAAAALFWLDFAWFREHLCLALCPYGRLQGALVDRDTVTIHYDAARGEPRGRILHGTAEKPRGDCVDCVRCVVVCPTAIDIRQGQQLECLACAQCADACDEVMRKVGRPTGLVRYDSLNGIERQPRRIARGRLFAYGGAALAAVLALVVTSANRSAFEVTLLRSPGLPWSTDSGVLRNRFGLHLVNKNAGPARLSVQVDAPGGTQIVRPPGDVELEGFAHFHFPVVVGVQEASRAWPFELRFRVGDGATERTVEARFLGPR